MQGASSVTNVQVVPVQQAHRVHHKPHAKILVKNKNGNKSTSNKTNSKAQNTGVTNEQCKLVATYTPPVQQPEIAQPQNNEVGANNNDQPFDVHNVNNFFKWQAIEACFTCGCTIL